MSDETVLVLGDIVIPVGAGREISQTLEPIDNGDLRRTINGTLVDITRNQNRKYQSTINATDLSTPALDDLWKGQVLSVENITPHRQNVYPANTVVTLIRDPVAGAVKGLTAAGAWIDPVSVIGNDATFGVAVSMVEFRSVMNWMIVGITKSKDEYSAAESWSLQLEEV